MKIEVIASGSSGNVTAVRAEKFFRIDCGMPYMWTMARLKELPDAILITHEHGDHAKAAKQFYNRQVDMYMTAGTANALKLEPAHNLHTIHGGYKLMLNNCTILDGYRFTIGDVTITPIPSNHDAAEPVNFILEDSEDRVLFVTDTGAIPEVHGDFTKIFIEANYSMQGLMWSDTVYRLKERISLNHLSIESAEKFLAKYPNAEKTLLHISKRHGNEDEFYERINTPKENKIKSETGTRLESTV